MAIKRIDDLHLDGVIVEEPQGIESRGSPNAL
jgi:hypothetical protein